MRSFCYLKYTINKTLFITLRILALGIQKMNAKFLSLDQQNLISQRAGPLKETVFAFKPNMRGFRGVKPPVH